MKKLFLLGIVFACVFSVFSAPTNAATLTISTFDNGWYDQNGNHSTGNTNIWTGAQGSSTSNNTNHFLAFDLTTAAGQTVTGATLTYFAGNGDYNSSDSSETVNWYDYSGNIDDLLNGSGGISAYSDLANGNIYGSETVVGNPAPTPGSGDPMPEVTTALTALALSDINAVLLSPDKRFIIGASIITAIFGEQQKLWYGSNQTAAQLTLEFSAVPVPPAVWLFGSGLLGLIGIARRKRSS